jgi:predicted nucleic acid-binding protein/Arc/MetJ family transcription regulator
LGTGKHKLSIKAAPYRNVDKAHPPITPSQQGKQRF